MIYSKFSSFTPQTFSFFGKIKIGKKEKGNRENKKLSLKMPVDLLKSVAPLTFCQIYELRCFKSTLIRKNYVLKNVFS